MITLHFTLESTRQACFNPVPPALLGAVQCAIGDLEEGTGVSAFSDDAVS